MEFNLKIRFILHVILKIYYDPVAHKINFEFSKDNSETCLLLPGKHFVKPQKCFSRVADPELINFQTLVHLFTRV